MVERFNGRISEVLAMYYFDSRASLEQTLKRYVHLYNQHLPQKALGHIAAIDAMKSWHAERYIFWRYREESTSDPITLMLVRVIDSL